MSLHESQLSATNEEDAGERYAEAESERRPAREAVLSAAYALQLAGDDDETLSLNHCMAVAYWLCEHMKKNAPHTLESVQLNTAWSHLLRLGDEMAWTAEECARHDVFAEDERPVVLTESETLR